MSMENEGALLEAVRSGGRPEAARLVGEWTTRLSDLEGWRGLVRDESLEEWRRLTAFQVLLDHGIAYPVGIQEFLDRAVHELGFEEAKGVDMSRSSFVPLARKEGERPFMINLPIRTPIGPASLYYSVDEANQVRQARVYPSAADA